MTIDAPTDATKRPGGVIPRELGDSTGFLLGRLGLSFKALANAAAETAGFAVHDYAVLAILGEGARETQAAIADALLLDPSRLVALLDSLEQRSLVVRQRDPEDRRRHVVSITDTGRAELARLRKLVKGLEDNFFAPLGADERTRLHALLAELAAQNDPRCCFADDLG